jgi:hypothetical protein
LQKNKDMKRCFLRETAFFIGTANKNAKAA